MKKQKVQNPEKSVKKWWLNIRWFLTVVLFSIGILRIGQLEQNYVVLPFILAFLGINLLNLFYYLQIENTNEGIKAAQIFLDILFITLLVHLTGGLTSPFAWIYLLAIVTASITVEENGGFIASIISSVCLLFLLVSYNFLWLTPVDASVLNTDTQAQTIFMISYLGLFAGMAFLTSFISDMLKRISIKEMETQGFLNLNRDRLIEKESEIIQKNRQIERYKEVLDTAREIVDIERRINNPLTVFSLASIKVADAAEKYKDENLGKMSEQIDEALDVIKQDLQSFHQLKQMDVLRDSNQN